MSGPSSGPIDAATDGIDCALTATITTSWTPSSAAASVAAVARPSATPADPSGRRTRSPSALIARSVSPRASTDAVTPSTPASPDAMTPPIDPAPTTQIRMTPCSILPPRVCESRVMNTSMLTQSRQADIRGA